MTRPYLEETARYPHMALALERLNSHYQHHLLLLHKLEVGQMLYPCFDSQEDLFTENVPGRQVKVMHLLNLGKMPNRSLGGLLLETTSTRWPSLAAEIGSDPIARTSLLLPSFSPSTLSTGCRPTRELALRRASYPLANCLGQSLVLAKVCFSSPEM